MEKRMNALATQFGQGQEDTPSSPPSRTEQELSAHNAHETRPPLIPSKSKRNK